MPRKRLEMSPPHPLFAPPWAQWAAKTTRKSGRWIVLAAGLLVALSGLSSSCSEGKKRDLQTEKKAKPPERRPPGLDPDKPGKSAAAKSISQRILFKRAMEAQRAGEADGALSLYTKAAEKVPSSKIAARSHLAMGQIWDSKGEHQRALAAYGKALALDEGNVAALHAMALAYEATGKSKKAWATFAKARALEKEDLTLCADGARIALAAGHQKKALQLLSEYEARRDSLIQTVLQGAPNSKGSPSPSGPPSKAPPKPRPLSRKIKRALKELASVPDAKTARGLWPLLKARRLKMRKEVARILGVFRYKESLTPLKNALEKEEKRAVKEALRRAVGAINENPRSFPKKAPSPRAAPAEKK